MSVAIPIRWLEALHAAAKRPRHLRLVADNAKQLAFVTDKAKRRAALCGRRAGKTTAIAVWLYEGMLLRPGTRQVYIGLTRGAARQILWDGAMAKLVKRFGWPLRETTVDGQIIIRHPNGSSLWVAGCDDKRELDKFRGQAFFRVSIDEAQGFPEDVLKPLVEDVIDPALADEDGELALSGTPSPVDIGYFYDVTSGHEPGWSCHYWDILDNPHFLGPANDNRFTNRAEEVLADAAVKLGSTEHPTYQREWRGKWVHDAGALVYPFSDKNRWTPHPEWPYGLNPDAEWVFGLGVDLGYSEGAKTLAFTLAAKQRDTGNGYLLKSYLKDRMYPGLLAEYCRGIREKLARETGCGLRIVVDEGGLGGGWTEQMQMLGVACEAAEKREKRAYQEYVGGLISSGQLKADFAACADLINEARKLPFDPETGKENELFRRHCCDSALYIVRALFPKYSPEEQGPKPEIGTPAWHNQQVKSHREQLIREQKKRRQAG